MPNRATDHAVLRYLERVAGFDIEAIRRAMEAQCGDGHGAPCVRIAGARYLIRDGAIVSVLSAQTVPHHHVLKSLMRARPDTNEGQSG